MHKVLLVDDMRRFLDLTRSFLSRSDCRLLTAATGLEAIKVARREAPDLIVLDIEMPEMNGIEACRILKAEPSTRAIPIVMLTSLPKEEEARRAGADHFLMKPIDEDHFLEEVRRFLPIVERKEPRVAIELAAEVVIDGRTVPARIVDISRSGAFLTGLEPLPAIGDQFHVNLAVPADGGDAPKRLSPKVVVVRRSEGRGIGVRILEATSAEEIYLEELVERQLGANP